MIVGIVVESCLGITVRFEKVVIVVLDIAPKFIFSNDPVLEPQALLPRIEVHLADGDGVVIVCVEQFGQRR